MTNHGIWRNLPQKTGAYSAVHDSPEFGPRGMLQSVPPLKSKMCWL